ncbi:DUF3131 domain-containing protein [Loktanella sp. IMCC34160]|uniref:DUF3131 domain-containing protein n=1 Tax=Loktanella sp. IMCC34160 TaxID=2510646 RepID=UPI0013EC9C8D|nr:DUF3131 domain-containing protein [Loktanella sp. IMCC34160]
MQELAETETGLIEIAAQRPRLSDERRYFQMRAAADLRAAILTGNGTNPPSRAAKQVITILDDSAGPSLDHAAFRGAGFRVFLQSAPDEETSLLDTAGREQIQMTGMRPITSLKPEDIGAEDIIISYSVDQLAALTSDEIEEHFGSFTDDLQRASLSGEIFVVRPIDLLLQAGTEPAPGIGLILPALSDRDEDRDKNLAVAAFAGQLDAANVPYERLDNRDEHGFLPDGAGGFIQVVTDGNPDAMPAAATRLVLPGIADGQFGLHPDGQFQLAGHGASGMSLDMLLPLDPVSDMAVLVPDTLISTYLDRAAVVHRLVSMRREGRAKLFHLGELARHIAAQEPILDKFRTTRARGVNVGITRVDPAAEEHAELMQDAGIAWAFIDRHTHPTTGLCAGTVRGGPDGLINPDATMWDVASQIQGIISARALGLIPTEDARDRLDLLLANLPTITAEEVHLPPARLNTATARANNRDFDACDTGRFLIAANAIVSAGIMTRPELRDLLPGWDLGETVRDGHPYNLTNGRWIDRFQSHCSQYSRVGYGTIGIGMDSPFAQPAEETETDRRIRLLYDAAKIGHFGTEPGLLHRIELGPDAPTDYLSEVLFDAQLRWFERTGEIKCASETLLDFAPWFSYQGLRFDRPEGEDWVVEFIEGDRRFASAEFRDSAEVISTKSAFLWAATVDHPHVGRMLGLIREKTRIAGLGFSAGVYAHSQEAMRNYSDVNTNGIILTAIARMLT